MDPILRQHLSKKLLPWEEEDPNKLMSLPTDPPLDTTALQSPVAQTMVAEDPPLDVTKLQSPVAKAMATPPPPQKTEQDLLNDYLTGERADSQRLRAGIGMGIQQIIGGLGNVEPATDYSQLQLASADKMEDRGDRNRQAIRDYLLNKDRFAKELDVLKENIRHNRALEGLARGKADQEAKEKLEPKQLPAAQIAQIKEGEAIPNLLGKLEATIKSSSGMMGPIQGRIASANEYNTEAQKVKASVEAATQIVGKYLEGGVLRKEDVPKYKAMLPQLSDQPEVALDKLQKVYSIVKEKQEGLINAVKEQKYSTAGFSEKFPEMSADSPAETGAYEDPEKEKRYQEWKASRVRQ